VLRLNIAGAERIPFEPDLDNTSVGKEKIIRYYRSGSGFYFGKTKLRGLLEKFRRLVIATPPLAGKQSLNSWS